MDDTSRSATRSRSARKPAIPTASATSLFSCFEDRGGWWTHELRNHGVAGETSGSLRTGGQLTSGLTARPRHRHQGREPRIGANDSSACSTGFHQPSCPFEANFSDTLNDLNGALAGDPGSEDLLVMTYYNPDDGNRHPGGG